ncbi:hypothetical protein NP233_g10619 [Leucocoprinus birnbaumii]|uniref:Uncharacterized protein n=1 Tax=Leucocoprinus birnbaumii TaxID=56174 RepID=A0AAD5YRP8_9AGAR|nr:hypothetical protein NP233_g10619 [Leucocoprinus birnbaumii]
MTSPFLVASPTTRSRESEPDLPSPLILILLPIILLSSSADLALSLINNLGLPSLFLSLIASFATIIHILTNLFIILYRLCTYTHTSQHDPGRSRRSSSRFGWDWELLPPTSKVSSITMDLILSTLYIVSFTTTLLLHFLDYFGGGTHDNDESSASAALGNPRDTSLLEAPSDTFWADAGLQLASGIFLGALAVLGILERRRFRAMTRMVPLGDG